MQFYFLSSATENYESLFMPVKEKNIYKKSFCCINVWLSLSLASPPALQKTHPKYHPEILLQKKKTVLWLIFPLSPTVSCLLNVLFSLFSSNVFQQLHLSRCELLVWFTRMGAVFSTCLHYIQATVDRRTGLSPLLNVFANQTEDVDLDF